MVKFRCKYTQVLNIYRFWCPNWRLIDRGVEAKFAKCKQMLIVYTLRSSRPSFRDDAITYVQLKLGCKLRTVKCKICLEHMVHSKLHGCTLVIDQEDDVILSVQRHDCVASKGGCKHATAFLMWIHRWSEELSCTSEEWYWKNRNYSVSVVA